MVALEDAAHKGEIAVRGEPLAEVGRRAIYDDPEAGPAGLREVPRSWVAFDWDNLEVAPAATDLADDPAEACAWNAPDPLLDPEVGVRRALLLLPPPFRKASCGWQISASAGLKPGFFRLRSWHLLDHPSIGAELCYWLEPPIVAGVLDPVTLRPVQPHYLAIAFVGGDDPCPRRFGILERAAGDLVQVPDLAGRLRRQQEAVREARREAARRRPRTALTDDSGVEFLRRCVETVRCATESARHATYLAEAARTKAFCDKYGVEWAPWKMDLMDTYESILTPVEASRRRRGSIEGVMKWVERR